MWSQRLERLLAFPNQLSSCSSRAACAEALLDACLAEKGLISGNVFLWTPDGSSLELIAIRGYPEASYAAWRFIPCDAPVPLAEAARSGKIVFLGSRVAWTKRYPQLATNAATTNDRADAVVPLLPPEGGKTIGVLGLSFDSVRRRLTSADQAYLAKLAALCVAAIRRLPEQTNSAFRATVPKIPAALSEETEKILLRSEERYATFTASVPDGIWDWDLKTDTVYYSPRWKEMVGYRTAEEQAEVSPSVDFWFSRIHPDDRERMETLVQDHLKGKSPLYRAEFRFRHRDGSWRWYMTRGRVFRDDAGQPYRFAGAQIDITERKEQEMALRAAAAALQSSEERFRAMSDAAPLGVFVTDSQGDCLYANAAWARIAGRDAAAALGNGWREAIHPEDRKRVIGEWNDAVRDDKPLNMGVRYQCPDNRPCWVRLRLAAMRKEDSTHFGYVGLVEDITEYVLLEQERAATQEALRLSEERYQQAVGGAQAGVWGWDLDSDEHFRSTHWKTLLGYVDSDADTLVNDSSLENIVHPDDFGPMVTAVNTFIDGETEEYEHAFRMRHRDGSWRWFLSRAHAERGDDGKACRISGIYVDITDRKAQEDQTVAYSRVLRESLDTLVQREAQIRAIGDNLPNGFVYQMGRYPDGTYKFTHVSAGIARITGVRAREVLLDPTRLFDLFLEEDRRTLVAAVEKSFRDLSLVDEETRFHRRSDGTIGWWNLRATPHRLPGGAVVWDGVAVDITERKRSEAERQRLSERDHRVAEVLQAAVLPVIPSDAMPGVTICSLHEPASDEAAVGGDFYDAFPLTGGRFAVVIGDVIGHGLSAALSIAEVRFALRGFLSENAFADPADTLRRLNRFLTESQYLHNRWIARDQVARNSLVALTLVVIDTARDTARISSAGMEPSLLLRAGTDSVQYIDAAELILGVDRNGSYRTEEVSLAPGDILALTTDGITEARPTGGVAQFGLAGLGNALCEQRSPATTTARPLEQIGQQTIEAARSFAGGSFRDDVCLILIERTT